MRGASGASLRAASCVRGSIGMHTMMPYGVDEICRGAIREPSGSAVSASARDTGVPSRLGGPLGSPIQSVPTSDSGLPGGFSIHAGVRIEGEDREGRVSSFRGMRRGLRVLEAAAVAPRARRRRVGAPSERHIGQVTGFVPRRFAVSKREFGFCRLMPGEGLEPTLCLQKRILNP